MGGVDGGAGEVNRPDSEDRGSVPTQPSAASNVLRVSLGIGLAGLGSFLLLAVAARAMPADQFAVLATWWALANLVAMVFVVLELYLPQAYVQRVAAAGDPGPLVAATVRLAAWGLLVVVLVALVGAPVLADRLFGGDRALVALVVAFSCAAVMQAVQRGVAAGRGRFWAVTAQLGADGVLRAGGPIALAATGQATPRTVAASLVAAAVVGLVAASPVVRGWFRWRTHGEALPWRPVGLLLPATAVPQLLNNGPVPLLAAAGNVPAGPLGAFAGAVTLSRLPTFFSGAVYGPVVNPLSRAIETGDRAGYRTALVRAASATAGAGLAFVLAFVAVGPWLLRLYLGSGYEVSRQVLALLAVTSALMFVATVAQAGLVASRRWGVTALAWAAAAGTFVAVLLVLGPYPEAAAGASAAGMTVATVWMGWAALAARRR